MRIQSPLSNLRDVLIQVREAAKTQQNQKTLQSNEDATRAALIDPVLHALGWRTAEVSMVEVEKTMTFARTNVRADYALLDSNQDVQVIVEAKKLAENLQPYWTSMVPYAAAFGVNSVFLSDGLAWHHFEMQNVNMAQIKPTIYDITKDDLGQIAAYLVHHLDAANYWSEEQGPDALLLDVEQLRNDVADLKQQLAALSGKGNLPPIVSPLKWVPLDKVKTATNTRPTSLRRPDDQEVQVRYWKDVLRECCKYALDVNPALTIPYADKAGQKVKLIDTVPPSSNLSSVSVVHQGRTLYIYTNYDAATSIANALHILNDPTVASKHNGQAAVVYG